MRSLQKLQQNLFICASSIAQQAGIAALRQADSDVERMKQIYDERRRYMISRLREMGFEIKVEPQGAFYIFADARKFTTDSYRFAFDVLENAHVGITPGIDFGTGGEGYVRFSYPGRTGPYQSVSFSLRLLISSVAASYWSSVTRTDTDGAI